MASGLATGGAILALLAGPTDCDEVTTSDPGGSTERVVRTCRSHGIDSPVVLATALVIGLLLSPDLKVSLLGVSVSQLRDATAETQSLIRAEAVATRTEVESHTSRQSLAVHGDVHLGSNSTLNMTVSGPGRRVDKVDPDAVRDPRTADRVIEAVQSDRIRVSDRDDGDLDVELDVIDPGGAEPQP